MGQPKKKGGRVTKKGPNWTLIRKFWPNARPGNLPSEQQLDVLEAHVDRLLKEKSCS